MFSVPSVNFGTNISSGVVFRNCTCLTPSAGIIVFATNTPLLISLPQTMLYSTTSIFTAITDSALGGIFKFLTVIIWVFIGITNSSSSAAIVSVYVS